MVSSDEENHHGRLKIYNQSNENECLDIEFHDGCYGIHAMKNHLLVGNEYGCISFIPLSNFD